MTDAGAPLRGVRVVEVAVGASDLGLGLAGGVPGRVLADLGADVTRVVGAVRPAIDADVPWTRPWHRGKRIVVTDDASQVRALVAHADVALVYGPDALVEGRGLGEVDVREGRPDLVYVRCRGEWSLLVEAASGFCTQLAGHRPGPIHVDGPVSAAGASFLVLASALVLLRERAVSGEGGSAETSLYDGMLATLGCMIGRSERAPAEVERYWEKGSWYPNFLYRCSDGELVQVWFGGKGMYEKLIEVLDDEPSEQGYYQDQATGRLAARKERWTATFATRPRDEWIARLREAGVACEPVLAPGEALRDPHLHEVGLAVDDGGEVLVGNPITVAPFGRDDVVSRAATSRPNPGGGLLTGLRVVDFSAFVAGPLAAQVLADLGADVVKVEPPSGEAMRAAAYAVAACQRGKRSLALDIAAPDARPVVERLLRTADVVLHNFRVGVAERLGIDAGTVARVNPGAVHCHASAFGPHGPRARFPGNDALMQALTGLERAVGGEGNEPIALTWIPIDMCGGWVAAAGILAGLHARVASGTGQEVATSLLGAGMLVQSGTYLRDGGAVRPLALDAAQTGFGPGYRLYRGGDGAWFAVVVADEAAWSALRDLVPDLPATYAPLRGGDRDREARAAEAALEATFAAAPAGEWVDRLRAAGVAVEHARDADRDAFRRGILDDPTNRALGRVASYDTAEWGHFDQIGPLLRTGPTPPPKPPFHLPGIGEHTVEVLRELGFAASEIDALLASKVARQL